MSLGAFANAGQKTSRRRRYCVGYCPARMTRQCPKAMCFWPSWHLPTRKPGAKEALTILRARGIKTVMVSGDNRGAAEDMARRLGLHPEDGEVMADVLPGDKAAWMLELKEDHGVERRRAVRTKGAPVTKLSLPADRAFGAKPNPGQTPCPRGGDGGRWRQRCARARRG